MVRMLVLYEAGCCGWVGKGAGEGDGAGSIFGAGAELGANRRSTLPLGCGGGLLPGRGVPNGVTGVDLWFESSIDDSCSGRLGIASAIPE